MIFDLLPTASILILAASQPSLCTTPKPTEIEVIPSSKTLRYDYSQSLKDLQGVEIDTINPHSFGGVTMTQGYMKGGIKLVPKVELNYKIFEAYKAACVWYDKVTIKMEIDPTIIIAKEVKADACMNEAVTIHEMKHIRADRKIVNKYSAIMGERVNKALEERGFMAGPIKADMVKAVADRMQKTVFQIVEHEYKKMDLERAELQQAIDNKAEYERVSAQCPDFNPMKFQKKKR